MGRGKKMDNKLAYRSPTLTNYGSIAKLTQAGTSLDGGGGGGHLIDIHVNAGIMLDITIP
jgi:hypothetical protein